MGSLLLCCFAGPTNLVFLSAQHPSFIQKDAHPLVEIVKDNAYLMSLEEGP